MAPDPVDFCIAQDMVAIRADPSKIYPPYLFAILRSELMQLRIGNMHVGSLIPHFKKGDFDKLLVPLPDDDVQYAIGDNYLLLSQKIESNHRMNATLEAMARALFQSWFVDFDPVRAKAAGQTPAGMDPGTADLFPSEFEDSELREIPKGWKANGLGAAIQIFDSKRIPLSKRQREERRGPYPYYGAASVMDYVDNYLFDGTYVLMGEDGSVANEDGTPVLQYVWGKFWVNNHAHVLLGNAGVSTEHLYLHLAQTNIKPFVNGAVQPKLNQGNMNRIPFVLPSAPICEAFAELIDPVFALFRANSDQSRTLAALRDALLPKLLSGELAAHDIETGSRKEIP